MNAIFTAIQTLFRASVLASMTNGLWLGVAEQDTLAPYVTIPTTFGGQPDFMLDRTALETPTIQFSIFSALTDDSEATGIYEALVALFDMAKLNTPDDPKISGIALVRKSGAKYVRLPEPEKGWMITVDYRAVFNRLAS